MNITDLHRILLFLLLFSVGSATRLSAQADPPRADLRDLYSWGDDYFIEIATLPGETGNKSRLVVLFRLTYDLLTFRKTTVPGGTDDLFIALPSLYVEVEAGDGVVVDYGSWSDTIRTTEYRQTNSKIQLAAGGIELEARPGVYTLTYTVDDGTPGGRFTRTTPPFTLPDFGDNLPAIGAPIMLRGSIEGDIIHPAGIDGGALFGQPVRAFIPFAAEGNPEHLRCEFFAVERDEKTGEPHLLRSLGNGLVTMLGPVTLRDFQGVGSELVGRLQKEGVPEGIQGAFCEFDASSLQPGEYALEMTLTAGERVRVDTQFFQVKWINMPYTLSSPTYAIKALWPIATDDEIDQLLGAGKNRHQEVLWEYWKNLDPTPETVYNERMAEYYRRVDYAFFNFATLKEQDGVFTDRGKIYILFGPPTNTRREYDPEANPREIWTYDNVVKREFVFQDRSETGAYHLVEYYDL